MHKPNIYVNNSKFKLIVDNVSVLQLLRALFILPKICPGLTVFNSISVPLSDFSLSLFTIVDVVQTRVTSFFDTAILSAV